MKAYTTRQYYVKERTYQGRFIGWGVYRDGNLITSMQRLMQAELHAEKLNDQFGDLQAYELLDGIRNEITLYEDGDFSAEAILESVKAMLDSRQKN